MMDAGRLDRQVTLRRASAASSNGFNEPVAIWSDLATVRAGFAPVSDGERLRAGETLANMQCRFTVRWSATTAGVDPRDRLIFDGREFDINGVKETGRRDFIEITATARAETP